MHGQLAVYGCFVFQALGMLIAVAGKVPPVAFLPAAAAIAGFIVTLLALWTLGRRGIRVLPEEGAGPGLCLGVTAAGLGLACLAGWLWLRLLTQLPVTAEYLQSVRRHLPAPGKTGDWIVLLACVSVIVPVCEEYIFRGLAYQGLRRTCGVVPSVLWSSLFFTAVHPVQSSAAVFTLAVVNALVMERTGRLWPCVVIHAGYNAFVLWVQS
jgi:hypothetical protein